MIKLTNAQLNAFNAPIITQLFQDTARQFPVKDAFMILDAIQAFQPKLQVYNAMVQNIVKKYNGTPQAGGGVECEKMEDRISLQKEIDDLNEIEVQVKGVKPVRMGPEWPKLTISEAAILRPLIETNG